MKDTNLDEKLTILGVEFIHSWDIFGFLLEVRKTGRDNRDKGSKLRSRKEEHNKVFSNYEK